MRSARRFAKSSATASATWKRFADVHASPMLRIFASSAPSIDVVEVGVLEDEERRVAAELHRHAEDLLRGLLDQLPADLGRAREGELAGARVADQRLHDLTRRLRGDDVEDAARKPASSRIWASAVIDSGVCFAGFMTIVQPAAMAGPELARPHGQREVPRSDEEAGPDGLLHRDDPAGALLVGRVATLDPDRLLREPAEELGGVRDLGLGLGDRLAHLQRHQQRELVVALDDRLVGAAQDLAALARRLAAHSGPALDGGLSAAFASSTVRVGDLAESLLGGRVLHLDGRAARRLPPLAADVELLGSRVDDCLLSGCDCHVRSPLSYVTTVSVPSSSDIATSTE